MKPKILTCSRFFFLKLLAFFPTMYHILVKKIEELRHSPNFTITTISDSIYKWATTNWAYLGRWHYIISNAAIFLNYGGLCSRFFKLRIEHLFWVKKSLYISIDIKFHDPNHDILHILLPKKLEKRSISFRSRPKTTLTRFWPFWPPNPPWWRIWRNFLYNYE